MIRSALHNFIVCYSRFSKLNFGWADWDAVEFRRTISALYIAFGWIGRQAELSTGPLCWYTCTCPIIQWENVKKIRKTYKNKELHMPTLPIFLSKTVPLYELSGECK